MKKILLVLLALIAAAALGWLFRAEIILGIAENRSSRAYADLPPNKEVPWQWGPAVAAAPINERPPNIILIVADDLGYNDISTFGGGVGGMETPGIDRLAAEGAVFRQSYSGASTCAPSRAMMMTGR